MCVVGYVRVCSGCKLDTVCKGQHILQFQKLCGCSMLLVCPFMLVFKVVWKTGDNCKHAHTHTQPFLWLYGFGPGQPGWAGTRRNIHPLTPIVVISCTLSASSIYYDPWW